MYIGIIPQNITLITLHNWYNLEERLVRHNKGYVPATKNIRPVELITYVVFSDKYKAFEFEKYLKSGSGRAFLHKRLI